MDLLKLVRSMLVGLVLLTLVSSAAMAGNTANQTVTFEVQAINEVAVSGNPAALIVNSATAGSEPVLVSDASTTYDITTNGTNKKITAAINTNMPANVTLTAALAAPTGGTSAGDTTLSTVAANVVTAITQKAETAKTITYKLSATVAAGVVVSDTKTVTLTLTD